MAYHFRLRIRNAADSADECIFSSLSTDTLPHLASEPFGDGQEFDHLTGRTTIGAYVIDVVDAVVSGSTRAVTQFLVDATLRQQLIGRRAYIEYSTNAGGAWTGLVGGFVTRIALVSAQRYSFTIGEARRVEERLRIFKAPTDAFQGFTNLLGWPFLTPWGSGGRAEGHFFPARTPWDFQVEGTSTDNVSLRLAGGMVPVGEESPDYVRVSAISPFALQRASALFAPDFVPSQTYLSGIPGTYPEILIFVKIFPDGATYGPFTAYAFAGTDPNEPPDVVSPFAGAGRNVLSLIWPGGEAIVSAGDFVSAWAYRSYVSRISPLHVEDHPIDVVTALWDEAGLPYSASAAAATKEALGDSLAMLRIVEPPRLDEFVSMLGLYWGFGVRVNASGERELFISRIRSASAPGSTITASELRSAEPVVFAVDDSTLKNNIVIRTRSFTPWAPGGWEREADEVVDLPNERAIDNGEIPEYGSNDLVISLPGQGVGAAIEATAYELLDRFGRGGQYSELLCLPAVTAKVGEEVALNLGQLPVGNVRGGTRFVQVVKRTPMVNGPLLRVLDAGSSAQASPAPTFSIAAGATLPKKNADVTITNAAALNAASVTVRVEWMLTASQPAAAALLRVFLPGEVPALFATPPVNAGEHIWMRMRSELPFQRPSAWSAWHDVDLANLTAPSGVSFTQDVADDDGVVTVHFTPGESDQPTDVLVRDQLEPTAADRLVTTAPAGASLAYLSLIPGEDYTITLRTAEAPPFSGVSTDVATNYTPPGSAVALDPPTQAAVYSYPNSRGGSGGAGGAEGPAQAVIAIGGGPDKRGAFSTIGLSVVASTPHALVEFQAASEDSPGAGTYGAFTTYAYRESAGTAARTDASFNVPLGDGLRRKLRARMSRDDGATVSAFCPEQPVDPATLVPVFSAPTAGSDPGILVATGTGPWEYLTDGVTRSGLALAITQIVAAEHAFASPFSAGSYALDQAYAQQAVATTGTLVADYALADAAHASGTVAQVIGVEGIAQHSSAGPLTIARGVLGAAVLTGAGTTTTATGVAASVVKTGGGTITTAYGVKVEDITAGATNYALYTGAGLVRFGDDVEVIGDLIVGGAISYVDATITGVLRAQNDFTPTFPAQSIEGTYNSAAGSGTVITETSEIRQTVATTGTSVGLMGYAQATHTSGAVAQVVGIYGIAHTAGVGGTTTLAVGLRGGGNLAAGTVTSYASVLAGNPGGGATVTTAHGILVQAITVGATNWAILTEGTTPSSFGGAVTITGLATVNAGLRASHSGLYPLIGIRTSADTNVSRTAMGIQHTTTADMIDGFGVGWDFNIRDSAGVDNTIVALRAIRSGADNTGYWEVRPVVAGSAVLTATFAGTLTTLHTAATVSGLLTASAGTNTTHLLADSAALTADVVINVTGTWTTAGANRAGITSQPTFDSSVTGGGAALSVILKTAAAAFTMASGYGIYVAPGTKGAGSTITTQYGVYIDTQALGATNYAIYTNGTAPARFGGATTTVGLATFGTAPSFAGLLMQGRYNSTVASGVDAGMVFEFYQTVAGTVTAIALESLSITTHTSGNVDTVVGLEGVAYGQHPSPATVTHLRAVEGRAVVSSTGTTTTASAFFANGAASAGGTPVLTNATGLYVQAHGFGTNRYGVYIEDITGGSTNWAIYTDGTTASRFGGAVTVVGLLTASAGIKPTHILIDSAAMTADSVIQVTGTWTTSGSNRVGISSRPTFDSSVTTGGAAFSAALITAAASFTMASGYGLYVGPGSKGSGSTITTQYGVYIDTQALGGTNYALYTNGTAPSRFGGSLQSDATESYFGAVKGYIYTRNDELNFYWSTNAAATGYINFSGYQSGGTQFRNLIVADGKGATVATFTGSSKAATFAGLATASAGLVAGTDPGGNGLVRLDDDANGMSLRTVGTVSILGAPDSSIALKINGTIPGSGTSKVGLDVIDLIFSSSTTGGGAAIFAKIQTAATSFTMANGWGAYIGTPTVGAGSAITNVYGAYIDVQSGGGTKNIGLHLQTPTGTGAVIIDTQVGAQLTTAGVWTDAPSYAKLKDDIAPLSLDLARAVLSEIEPARFRFKATKRRGLGVVLDAYLPTMQRHGLLDRDEAPGVAATHLATLALAGWKAHDEDIAALRMQVADLQAQLNARRN